jgi:hypothetical protein
MDGGAGEQGRDGKRGSFQGEFSMDMAESNRMRE